MRVSPSQILALCLSLTLALTGCDSDGGTEGTPAAGGADAGAEAGTTEPDGLASDPDAPGVDPDADPTPEPDGGPDAAPDAEPTPEPGQPVPFTFDGNPVNGLWRVTVAIVEIGGIELPFQVEVTTSGSVEDDSLVADWALRAIGTDGSLLDEMGSASGTSISAEGEFTADFGSVILPGEASPTGTPIPLSLVLEGTFRANDFVCGAVTGYVVGLNITLADSTFGAIPWDAGDVAPADCTAPGGDAKLPRLTPDDCPTLLDGFVTGFESGGESRSFELVLPADHDPASSYPLIFAFHGLGGSYQWIFSPSVYGLVDGVDERGYILVSPQGRGLPASEYDQVTTKDSPDLAMFDDIITCATAQLGANPERIHVTGMSGGGLFTAYLTRMRPEVIASSAPMSGGLIVDYEAPSGRKPPVLVSWGGAQDIAVAQNFDTFAKELLEDLSAGGHFLAACNHGGGHIWPSALTEPVLDWLLDHPRDLDSEPYADGLPDSFPGYCELR